MSAAQFAVSAHVPVPLVMATVSPVIEHAPAAVIDAVVLAFVVAVTVNMEPFPAVVGAPVKVTVGAILVAAVDWLAVAEL